MGQFGFRDARTVIANAEACGIKPGRERDFNGGPFSGIANGVAHHVFNAAAQ